MTEFNLDLDALLEGVTPSMVTPHLGEISTLSNDKKPKKMAQYIVKAMHQQLGTPVMKEILHNGSIHQMRYFDIEPMMKGVWCEISLMLLHLSYGEQVTLIEALYPKDIQLIAKTFSAHFTKNQPMSPIIVEQDNKTQHQLEMISSGVALVLSTLVEMGHSISHPDVAARYIHEMDAIATQRKEQQKIIEQNKRKEHALKQRDKE